MAQQQSPQSNLMQRFGAILRDRGAELGGKSAPGYIEKLAESDRKARADYLKNKMLARRLGLESERAGFARDANTRAQEAVALKARNLGQLNALMKGRGADIDEAQFGDPGFTTTPRQDLINPLEARAGLNRAQAGLLGATGPQAEAAFPKEISDLERRFKESQISKNLQGKEPTAPKIRVEVQEVLAGRGIKNMANATPPQILSATQEVNERQTKRIIASIPKPRGVTQKQVADLTKDMVKIANIDHFLRKENRKNIESVTGVFQGRWANIKSKFGALTVDQRMAQAEVQEAVNRMIKDITGVAARKDELPRIIRSMGSLNDPTGFIIKWSEDQRRKLQVRIDITKSNWKKAKFQFGGTGTDNPKTPKGSDGVGKNNARRKNLKKAFESSY
jgi:hypothetical protein